MFSSPALFADGDDPPHSTSDESEHASAFHPNELAIFIGATDEKGHATELTFGAEYIRRLNERWGVGGLVDYAGGKARNLIVGGSGRMVALAQ